MNNTQGNVRLNAALLPTAEAVLAAVLCVTITLHPFPAFCYVPAASPV